MTLPDNNTIISTISTLIQLSVAPVFLLAGVAGLLNVFIGRLTRIIDKLERLDKFLHTKEQNEAEYTNEYMNTRRKFLVMRLQNTNLAIFFCTATGLLVALVILTIFFSALSSAHSETFISVLFILAMVCLIIALLLFLREIYFTTSYIKEKKSQKQKTKE
jgi:uncharacterized membrane protein